MPIGFFKKLFGGEAPEKQAPSSRGASSEADAVGGAVEVSGEADPKAFVEYIVGKLVSAPESVKVEAQRDGDSLTITVACDKGDMGRVIGKRGKTIGAIRSLAIDAAGRVGIRNLQVELQD